MKKVAILTDSTACLPVDLAHKYAITSVPLEVIWGTEIFEDGISLAPGEFYDRLKTAKVLPTTSQPSVGKMQAAMLNLLEQDFAILGIFLTSKFSGTYQAACQARDMLPTGSPVEVVDSLTTTLDMGFQILAAARAAEAGASLADCARAAEQVRSNSGIYFMVDTLEFLHRGGRIGGAQRFFGTALGTRPILYMHEGRIEPHDRVRTKSKALDRLVEIVCELCAGKSSIRLASVHANAPADARFVLEKASQVLKPVETLTSDLSPVIGIHAGPGTVALAYTTGA